MSMAGRGMNSSVNQSQITFPPELHEQVNELLRRCRNGEDIRNVKVLAGPKTTTSIQPF